MLDTWIEASPAASRIRRLDYVDKQLVPTLYRAAELSCYISEYEGFGLPPLESLACETPAVVSRDLYLEELWPDYPLLSASSTATDIAGVLDRALGDRESLSRIGRNGA